MADSNMDILNGYNGNSAEKFLESAGIRPTAMRLLILRYLDRAPGPASSLDMETTLETADRSTISRTLSTFLEHGLIHAIDDGSGSVKYELCRSHSHKHDSDIHPHFRCIQCGRTICLPCEVPPVPLPEGFEMENVNYVITGKCDRCS